MKDETQYLKTEDYVTCSTCGVVVEKKSAQNILCEGWVVVTSWYCDTHKKPYDRIYVGRGGATYYKNMVVGQDGVPIGYKKLPNQQKE